MPFLLGKKPHQPGAIKFRYSDIFNPKKLQKPPLSFGHVSNASVIPLLGNDKAGDCVWCTMAHLLQSMQRGVMGKESLFTEKSVLSDYTAVTGYDPGNPASDTGTFMKDAASYWRKTGIVDGVGIRHKVEAYVDVRFNDPEELVQATYDFGGVALGLMLPQSAMEQFDRGQIWTVPPVKKIIGGHAVALVGRNSRGYGVVATWNGITAVTPDFLRAFVDECVAFVSLEYLDARNVNPRGYDRTELMKMLTDIAV